MGGHVYKFLAQALKILKTKGFIQWLVMLPTSFCKKKSGKWTEEEEKRLAEVVHELTSTEPGDIVTQGVSWAAVAERVGTRSEKQCRSKWLNYLNWKQSGGTEWTKEDEINLILRFVLFIWERIF